MKEGQRIVIPLANGLKLAAEASSNPNYPAEIYIGLLNRDDQWHQDFAIIKANCEFDAPSDDPIYDETYNIFVYGDERSEDYTHEFKVKLYTDNDE